MSEVQHNTTQQKDKARGWSDRLEDLAYGAYNLRVKVSEKLDEHESVRSLGQAALVISGTLAVMAAASYGVGQYSYRHGRPNPTEEQQAQLDQMYYNTDPQKGPVFDPEGDGDIHAWQANEYNMCVVYDQKLEAWRKAGSEEDINQVMARFEVDKDNVFPDPAEDRLMWKEEDPRCTPDTE